ncbi:hypothetical protein M231_03735 [Tremella mesenterica]|uniref:Dystroglycan-type cadherin-like domain-containing protein n=1 Tax=Tremella mesenterica TaxID=5217 RepID=A0A4Q1BME7_TREME|nr:hypothetical protein M231_03735 [Tremella mesenterica]
MLYIFALALSSSYLYLTAHAATTQSPHGSVTVLHPLVSQFPPVARLNTLFQWTILPDTFGSLNNVQYTTPDLPQWLFFNTTSFTFIGTPSAVHIGNTKVTLRATTPSGTASTAVIIPVSGRATGAEVAKPLSQQLVQGNKFINSAYPYLSSSPYFPGVRVPPRWSFSIGLDPDTFVGSGTRIYATATQSDGTPLPTWLRWNNKTLTFDGVSPLLSSTGSEVFSLAIGASDTYGYTDVRQDMKIVVSSSTLVVSPLTLNVTAGQNISDSLQSSLLSELLDGRVMNDGEPLERDQYNVSIETDCLPWLTFDPTSLKLEGMVPQSQSGSQILPLVIRDAIGGFDNSSISLAFYPSAWNVMSTPSINVVPGQQISVDLKPYLISPDERSNLALSVQNSDGSSPSGIAVDSSVFSITGMVPTSSPQSQQFIVKALDERYNTSSLLQVNFDLTPAIAPVGLDVPLNTPSSNPGRHHKIAAIIGAILGSLALLLLGALALFLLRRRKQRPTEREDEWTGIDRTPELGSRGSWATPGDDLATPKDNEKHVYIVRSNSMGEHDDPMTMLGKHDPKSTPIDTLGMRILRAVGMYSAPLTRPPIPRSMSDPETPAQQLTSTLRNMRNMTSRSPNHMNNQNTSNNLPQQNDDDHITTTNNGEEIHEESRSMMTRLTSSNFTTTEEPYTETDITETSSLHSSSSISERTYTQTNTYSHNHTESQSTHQRTYSSHSADISSTSQNDITYTSSAGTVRHSDSVPRQRSDFRSDIDRQSPLDFDFDAAYSEFPFEIQTGGEGAELDTVDMNLQRRFELELELNPEDHQDIVDALNTFSTDVGISNYGVNVQTHSPRLKNIPQIPKSSTVINTKPLEIKFTGNHQPKSIQQTKINNDIEQFEDPMEISINQTIQTHNVLLDHINSKNLNEMKQDYSLDTKQTSIIKSTLSQTDSEPLSIGCVLWNSESEMSYTDNSADEAVVVRATRGSTAGSPISFSGESTFTNGLSPCETEGTGVARLVNFTAGRRVRDSVGVTIGGLPGKLGTANNLNNLHNLNNLNHLNNLNNLNNTNSSNNLYNTNTMNHVDSSNDINDLNHMNLVRFNKKESLGNIKQIDTLGKDGRSSEMGIMREVGIRNFPQNPITIQSQVASLVTPSTQIIPLSFPTETQVYTVMAQEGQIGCTSPPLGKPYSYTTFSGKRQDYSMEQEDELEGYTRFSGQPHDFPMDRESEMEGYTTVSRKYQENTMDDEEVRRVEEIDSDQEDTPTRYDTPRRKLKDIDYNTPRQIRQGIEYKTPNYRIEQEVIRSTTPTQPPPRELNTKHSFPTIPLPLPPSPPPLPLRNEEYPITSYRDYSENEESHDLTFHFSDSYPLSLPPSFPESLVSLSNLPTPPESPKISSSILSSSDDPSEFTSHSMNNANPYTRDKPVQTSVQSTSPSNASLPRSTTQSSARSIPGTPARKRRTKSILQSKEMSDPIPPLPTMNSQQSITSHPSISSEISTTSSGDDHPSKGHKRVTSVNPYAPRVSSSLSQSFTLEDVKSGKPLVKRNSSSSRPNTAPSPSPSSPVRSTTSPSRTSLEQESTSRSRSSSISSMKSKRNSLTARAVLGSMEQNSLILTPSEKLNTKMKSSSTSNSIKMKESFSTVSTKTKESHSLTNPTRVSTQRNKKESSIPGQVTHSRESSLASRGTSSSLNKVREKMSGVSTSTRNKEVGGSKEKSGMEGESKKGRERGMSNASVLKRGRNSTVSGGKGLWTDSYEEK